MRGLAAAVLLAVGTPALAAQAVATSVEELARASDAVVRGRVAGSRARQSEDGRRIFTVVELRKAAALRGRAPARLQVVVPGGVVGRLGQRVDGAPSFKAGEEVVVFLQRAAGAFRVTGLAQGKFTVDGEVARPDLSHLTFTQTSVRAGERRAEELPLRELERRVRNTR